VDSSSLLNRRKAYDFFLNAIEIVRRVENKILIPEKLVQEIEKTALSSTCQTAGQQASRILSVLPQLAKAGVIDICRSEDASQTSNVFDALFAEWAQTHDILFITQNSELAAKALAFGNPEDDTSHRIYVKRLSDSGELIEPISNQKDKPPAVKAGKHKTRAICCVPFYASQQATDETAALKRIIVDGHPTNYCISQDGLVYKIGYAATRNHCVETLREIQQCASDNGYNFVPIKLPGHNFVINVHRLVATAFCDQADLKDATIDHIDGNKLNNHFANLEWVTQEENQRRAIAMQGKAHGAAGGESETP
jgi:hypothetical protein